MLLGHLPLGLKYIHGYPLIITEEWFYIMPDNLFDDLFLFQDLSRGEAELVYPLFQICHESAGNVIFEQGDPAEFLYVVLEGEIAILYKPDDGPELVISRDRFEKVDKQVQPHLVKDLETGKDHRKDYLALNKTILLLL